MSLRLRFPWSGTAVRLIARRSGRRWPALLAVIALYLSHTAHGEEVVAVRAGLHDGFGRLVLEWPTPVEVTGEQEGRRYRLRFARPFQADLRAALRQLGGYLENAVAGPDPKELVLGLAPGVAVRQQILEARIVVLDLAPVGPGVPVDDVEVRTGLHQGFGRLVFHWPVPVGFEALQGDLEVTIRFDRAGAVDVSKTAARLAQWLEDAQVALSDGQTVARLTLRAGATARAFRVDDHRVVVDLSAAPAPAPPGSTEPQPQIEPPSAVRTAAPPAPEPETSSESGLEPRAPSGPASEAAAASAGEATSMHLTITSGADDVCGYLDFAWTQPVGAAVFVRAGYLWVVFAAETGRLPDLPLPPIDQAVRDHVGPGERVVAEGGTALRFPLRRPLAAEVARVEGMWRVRLREQATPPRPGHPLGVASPAGLRLAPGESPRLVTLRDPEVGDELTVWPLLQANLGQPARRLVDLELLATAQGLAWRLRRDGVEARVLADAVEFVAPGGLVLSGPGTREAPSPVARPIETNEPVAAPVAPARAAAEPSGEALPEPAFSQSADEAASASPIDLAGWHLSPARQSPEGRTDLPSDRSPDQRDARRLERARDYLSRARAAEALGVLGTIEQPENPATRQAQLALRGAAALLMGRIDDAAAGLEAPLFDGDGEVALWRAGLAAARKNWPEAVRQLQRSDQLLSSYPHPLRGRLGLAAARAAIETRDAELATALLKQLEEAELPHAERARLAFLSGIARARDGATGAADQIWRKLEQAGPVDVRVDAAFARTKLLLDAGRLKPAAAIARLVPTRGLWRGHPREATMLAALAEMYAAAGNAPDALRTWRELLDRNPDIPEAPALRQRMHAMLIETLLAEADGALGPLQICGLFREFEPLIPENALGDRVRRRVAQHLAELDLIRPAAALLAAVVDRLSGLERAAAGAELATLWLREGAAEAALSALDGSEGDARLPARLSERRRILRADALTRADRPAAALAVLRGLEAPAAYDLRVEILWRQEDWPGLIAAIESALGQGRDAALGRGEPELTMLVRLAVANARLGRSAALARLRERFADVFKRHALEEAFLMATAPPATTDRPDAVLAATERQARHVRSHLEAARIGD